MAGTAFQTRGASCGSMLNRIDAVPGGVMQIAFFVSVSILLNSIPKCNRLISMEPEEGGQQKWHVNLPM